MSAVKEENKAEKWRELTVLDVQSVQSPVNCLERYKIARSDQIWPEFIGLEWNHQLPAVLCSHSTPANDTGKNLYQNARVKLENVSDIFNYQFLQILWCCSSVAANIGIPRECVGQVVLIICD